jgi:SNF2 family DNA or RNA helicase
MIQEILFASQGVYQVLVKDAEEEYWVILQFNQEDMLSDSLCPCEEHEENSDCKHVKMACKALFNGSGHSLHTRFKLSLWNFLFRMIAEKIGFEVENLTQINPKLFEAYGVTGKCVFALIIKEDQLSQEIHSLLYKREKETEETSLKFAQLPQEEIALWREARPSFNLRYELSFWSDLAKKCMLLQDSKQEYKIEFLYSKKNLPHGLIVSFKDFSMQFYISEADIAHFIAPLSTVNSPLEVIQEERAPIFSIEYDEEQKSFLIEREKKEELEIKLSSEDLNQAIPIGEWLWVPQKGFYTFHKDDLLSKPRIDFGDIELFLNHHKTLIERHLKGVKLFKEIHIPSYKLYFDYQDNLYIEPYIHEVGDLQRPNSCLYGNFAYVEDVGFFEIQDLYFKSIKTKILKEDVSAFISQNRVWLSAQEGFATHLTSILVQLSYDVLDNNNLIFKSEIAQLGTTSEVKDFGDWVFVPNEGFYAKHFNIAGSSLTAKTKVAVSDIPLFIHMHQDELEQVKGFFTPSCPITDIKLKVLLQKDQSIKITPSLSLVRGYKESQIKFFGDFTFVHGEGFSLIPHNLRLKEQFRLEQIILKDNVDFFISSELELLKPFIEELDPRLILQKDLTLTLDHLNKKEEGYWSLSFSYDTQEGSLDVETIWKAIHEGKRYLFTSVGAIDLFDGAFQWLKLLDKSRIDHKNKEIKLTSLEILRLQCFNGIKEELKGEEKRSWQALNHFEAIDSLDLSLLKSNLRPYQDTGLKWLWFLYDQRLSGLLCDDMGLGKTHQAMALLAATFKKSQGSKFLVACPTSVIFHWQDKLKRFLPDLKVYTLYGNTRDINDFVQNYDLLLTSYGVLRVEQIPLSHIPFELAVFDEAQIAKNHLSQTHKALLALQARMKLGLTGTPIENRLRELKALFDVVLPSYMPSEEKYRELFVTPIEKDGDEKAKQLLAKFIKPFVLRRKKSEVLLELPEKVEEVVFAEFTEEQRTLYKDTLMGVKKGLEEDLKDNTKSLPYMSLFALLTKLKQICDHPAVFLKKPLEYLKMHSGKWNLFVELIDKAIESEQKVVVFSHYLDMLQIMQNHLKEKSIGYALVQGDTSNRQNELKRFQEDPKCMVFLGSLQAVGLGVELTSASIVIHYDRWWNPARENQATDRVYRMGQQRGVQVFKLVTKDTIEEYISKMIERKMRLMEEIVGSDDENTLKQLTRQEWLEILNLNIL